MRQYAASWVARGELSCLCDQSLSMTMFYAVSQRSAAENPLVRCFLASLIGNGARPVVEVVSESGLIAPP
jgi:hypothetical protein